ncbi:MAG: hypothetical protein DBX44_01370 [Oscillospiraceae bacterium]|nr:MAG: hypothetical protein DBX44_01370 [Oscillospiraceae bacterium]
MFQNFQAWKLHTFEDYLTLILVFVIGVVVFGFAIRRIYKRRNDAYAFKIVKKALNKLPAKEARVFHDITLTFGDKQLHYDHLLVDAAGIVAIRSIGWGIRIYGQADQPTWKAVDNKVEKMIDNPIAKLTETFDTLRNGLSSYEIYGLTIDPLAIFADPFSSPELYLGRDSYCIPFDELKKWKKQRRLRAENKAQKLDIAKTVAAIEAASKKA